MFSRMVRFETCESFNIEEDDHNEEAELYPLRIVRSFEKLACHPQTRAKKRNKETGEREKQQEYKEGKRK